MIRRRRGGVRAGHAPQATALARNPPRTPRRGTATITRPIGRQRMSPALDFVHRYVPGENAAGPTLLLLPGGKISEYGAPRFFRRLAEGVFDHEDLLFRTHELAGFVEAAAKEYGFD